MFCPNCGKEISDKSKFCIACGSKIEDYSKDVKSESNNSASPQIMGNDTKNNERTNVWPAESDGYKSTGDPESISGSERLEAEKKRREEAALLAGDGKKTNQSIGKIIRKKRFKAMLPIRIVSLLLIAAIFFFYLYTHSYTLKDVGHTIKIRTEQALGVISPKFTVMAFFDALKYYDENREISLISDDALNEITTQEESNEYYNDLLEYITELYGEMDYVITDTKFTNNSAEVTVEVEYKDATNVYLEIISELFNQSLSLAFSNPNITESEMDEILEEIVNDKKETVKPKNSDATISFTCKRNGIRWIIDDISPNIIYVMTCTSESYDWGQW